MNAARTWRTLSRRSAVLGLAALAWFALPAAAHDESPVSATFFLIPPPGEATLPAGAIYGPSTPIPALLQLRLRGDAVAPVIITQRWTLEEMRRFILVTTPDGKLLIPKGAELFHRHGDADAQRFSCTRLAGVRLSVGQSSSFPVTAAARLENDFFLEFKVDDLRTFFNLRAGRHLANVKIPITVYNDVVADCDGLAGEFVNLDAPVGSFQVISNSVEFINSLLNFVGFSSPLDCAIEPCGPFNLGNQLPVRFQLLDGGGNTVSTANVGIRLTDISAATGSVDLGTFPFDAANGDYRIALHTGQLAAGTWQVDALLEDGAVRSVRLNLQTLYTFEGFEPPLIGDTDCPTLDCNVLNLGQTVPMKFRLFDPTTRAPFAKQTIRVTLTGVDPAMPTSDQGIMRFQKSQDTYIFNLHTNGLAAGLWRLEAVFPDGSTQSAHVVLR